MPFGFQVDLDMERIRMMEQTMQNQEAFRTAAKRALDRTVTSSRAEANRQIKQRYDISTANLYKYSKVTLNKAMISGDEVVGEINFSGQKIPLYRFNVSPKKRTYTRRFVNGHSGWRVTSEVSAGDIKGQMEARPAAFIATFWNGHTGIFRRTGGKTSSGKSRIVEYWGMAMADMLDYEDARDAVMKKAQETFETRIEHEIDAVLNGGY